MRIDQIKIRPKFFQKGFCDLWGLKPLYDTNKPCVFFGIGDHYDIDAVKNHKGLKIVWFHNARGNQYVHHFIGVENLVVLENPYLDVPEGMRKKKINIPYKDYSMFTPTPLGDKIYCYVGVKSREDEFQLDRIRDIAKNTPYELITGYLGLPMQEVKVKYYDECFVNINLNKSGGGGWTSIMELGMMGRKTISNTKFDYPSIINFKEDCPNDFPTLIGYMKDEDIVRIILNEAKKIGTVQPQMSWQWATEEWLDTKFWEA